MARRPESVPSLLGVLGLLALGYLALLGFMYFTQNSLLFLPEIGGRDLDSTPERFGLEYREVTLTTSDGESLHGWFLPAPGARYTLLFFHGNAGNISHRLDSLLLFRQLGLSQLIFDYRGYGRSSGRPSEAGLYRDAQAAWDYLTGERGLEPGQIVLFGRSLGAAPAVWLAVRERPAGLIVESSFTSVPDLGAALYPWLPVRWLSRLEFDSRSRISRVGAPLLVVHSRDDEIIPFAHGQALFGAAKPPKRLLELRGGHNDGFLVSREHYLNGLRSFFDGLPRG
jgi:fermentation-respiration switch protein FrsA (DUF1100 family)